jgi:hypothetical protein
LIRAAYALAPAALAGTVGLVLAFAASPAPRHSPADAHNVPAPRVLDQHSIYLIHRATRNPDSDDYRIRIALDAERLEHLDQVESVVYVLHPGFDPREVPGGDRASHFALEIAARGEFLVRARVTLKGGRPPVQVSRYLNF